MPLEPTQVLDIFQSSLRRATLEARAAGAPDAALPAALIATIERAIDELCADHPFCFKLTRYKAS